MADNNHRGPITSMGALEDTNATTGTTSLVQVSPLDGPSIFYQDTVLADIRQVPFPKDGTLPGRAQGFASGANLWLCDAIPQKGSTTLISATQLATTTGSTLPLATTASAGTAGNCSLAFGVPIIPVGTTVATTAAIAIDFGFTTGTTATNSTSVVVVDNSLFHLGQWVVVGNVGNSTASRSLIAQIQSTSGTTTIYISPAAVTGLANVPIGQANLYGSDLIALGTQFGPQTASANAHAFGGAMRAGVARVMNPRETLARNISMAFSTSGTYSAVVSGWDVWGNPMTEIISLSAQSTGAGKRAFKYIGSITNGTASTVGLSFGLGDTFGFPVRIDEYEQTDIFWNGSQMTNNNGFTAATLVAQTGTSGDVRGTIQISTSILTGVLATSISSIASNGTGRLAIIGNIGVWNTVAGSPNNVVPMFGLAQSTATS